MAWYTPGIFTQFAVMLALFIAFAYLYWHDRQGYMLKWSVSWGLWGLKLLTDVLLTERAAPLFEEVNLLSWLFASSYLIWGTIEFSNKKTPRLWTLGTALAAIWSIGAAFPESWHPWLIIPVFLFVGAEMVWAGAALVKSERVGATEFIIGVVLIVWGIHLADYPLLSRIAWFVPWGYNLATVLAMLVAFGDLIAYYQQIRRDLSESRDEILRAESARRQLVANVSHDLRTPITSIRGYVEALLDGLAEDPEERAKYLNLIHRRVLGLGRLIQDLFDLAELESRQVTFRFEPVAVGELLQQVYDRHLVDATKAGLNLRLTPPPPACKDLTVVSDRDRMDEVFANLLTNAMRHTPAGGVITIGCDPAPGRPEVTMMVQDTGEGIADEDRPHVFDRFYRGSQPRRGQAEGHGLGLAIAKEIVEAHGGRIWVESTPGRGSTFRLSLPLNH